MNIKNTGKNFLHKTVIRAGRRGGFVSDKKPLV